MSCSTLSSVDVEAGKLYVQERIPNIVQGKPVVLYVPLPAELSYGGSLSVVKNDWRVVGTLA